MKNELIAASAAAHTPKILLFIKLHLWAAIHWLCGIAAGVLIVIDEVDPEQLHQPTGLYLKILFAASLTVSLIKKVVDLWYYIKNKNSNNKNLKDNESSN